MRVVNVHHRELPVQPSVLGALLDSLSQADDRLWPTSTWPAMRFGRPLQVGARGGHGPIRYTVESYTPGHTISFRFSAPRGFDGTHSFLVSPTTSGSRISHEIHMTTTGRASLSWAFVLRPLHDALLEDALHKAALACGAQESPPRWSAWVRVLRALLRSRKPPRAT